MSINEKESYINEKWSYQERLVVGYLIGSLIGVVYYAIFAFEQYQLGSFTLPTISKEWGSKLLIVMAVQIVATVLVSVVISIFHAMITREEDFSNGDERDNLIDLKANKISFTVFSIGFLIGIISLAVGKQPLIMFNIIVFSIFLASIVGFLVQLKIYKKGF